MCVHELDEISVDRPLISGADGQVGPMKEDGSLPNAVQGVRGALSIPTTVVIAVGLNPGQPSVPDHVQG